LKPEQWGSPLVQEKYQEEKAYDKRHPYGITTTTTTTTTTTIIIIHYRLKLLQAHTVHLHK